MRPWAVLCAAFPRQELGGATVEIYHARLKKYDVDLLIAAVNLAIDRCKFFPSVAELIENVAALGTARRLEEPKPSKQEAKAVLEALHEQIRQFESKDLNSTEKRIATRKAELAAQAKLLGVKSAK